MNATNITPKMAVRSLDALDILFFIQSSICICVSAFLIIFILTKKNLRCKNTHIFAVNFQSVHTLLCLTTIVIRARVDIPRITVNIFLMQMFFSLLFLTGDKYFAIQHPFRYQQFRKLYVFMIILSSWMLTVLFGSLLLSFDISPRYFINGHAVTTTLLIIAGVTLAISSIKIYLVSREHAKIIRQQATVVSLKRTRLLKSTYVTIVIVSSFIILQFPLLVCNLMLFATGKPNIIFRKLAIQSACLESMVDPILYTCFSRDIKTELKKYLCRSTTDNQVNPTSVANTAHNNIMSSKKGK